MADGSESKPKLGVSTCLLGERVRYDGGHKRDRVITDELGRFVEFVPVCPEVVGSNPLATRTRPLQ